MFILNGLDLGCEDRTSVLRESRKIDSALKATWSVYDEGRGTDAVLAFGRLGGYILITLDQFTAELTKSSPL